MTSPNKYPSLDAELTIRAGNGNRMFKPAEVIQPMAFDIDRPFVYIAGSMRNADIITVTKKFHAAGMQAFSSWHAVGPEADDHWKKYEQAMGHDYLSALKEPAAKNVFAFDKKHIDACSAFVLVLPAGKSAHLELGYIIGQGKPGYILLDSEQDRWDIMYQFATGIYKNCDDLIEDIQMQYRSQ